MTSTIIGRKPEINRIQDLFTSGKPEFIALFGRRRVGKTFLVRELLEEKFVFDLAGLAKSGMKKQLLNFYYSLRKVATQDFPVPSSWLEAFEQLIAFLEISQAKRKVIFIDEISWIDTQKSGFLTALEHFWNGWACSKKDIMLIVCGSATSWIINNLINNSGGLYNRVTASIQLSPFTLHETELFLRSKNIEWTHYQIAELYMITGGIPFYLEKIKQGSSLAQNIDSLFFSKTGELKNEFSSLYASLFDHAKDYEKVVEALSGKKSGLTRSEIMAKTKMNSGNRITTILNNLEYCDFIRSYSQPKRKNDRIFQLTDSFTLFHFYFLHKEKSRDEHFWTNSLNTSLTILGPVYLLKFYAFFISAR